MAFPPCDPEIEECKVQRYSNMGKMLQQAEERVTALGKQMQTLLDTLAI
jgi:hypothetical protein